MPPPSTYAHAHAHRGKHTHTHTHKRARTHAHTHTRTHIRKETNRRMIRVFAQITDVRVLAVGAVLFLL